MAPKLAELTLVLKENFFDSASPRISALTIVMKFVMRLAGHDKNVDSQWNGNSVSPCHAWCRRRPTLPKQPRAPEEAPSHEDPSHLVSEAELQRTQMRRPDI